MKLKDEVAWNRFVEANRDPYGRQVVSYSELWADLMEGRMKDGEPIADMAEETSHEANTTGITGFMYGCAVSVLSQCWEHGEELRRRHNLDSQIADEGEKANKSGGVLNPAILSIGESK